MRIKCERCRTEKFYVLLGATCAYVVCVRCGQELGTVAENLVGIPAAVPENVPPAVELDENVPEALRRGHAAISPRYRHRPRP